MCKFQRILFNFVALVSISEGARILAVFPAPYISHQTVFRPLTQELARRGHELVIITPDPAFKNPPPNITEIDLHKVSYEVRNNYTFKITGNINDVIEQIDTFVAFFTKLFDVQINTPEVQNLIYDKDQHFDLVIVEEIIRPALVFSHIYKAPVITISSLGSISLFTKYSKVAPDQTNFYHQSYVWKLWEKAKIIFVEYLYYEYFRRKEMDLNDMLKKNFGPDVPVLDELRKNVALSLINLHHVWEEDRPVPPEAIYLGGLHLEINDTKELSTELKTYLDSSTHGVVYMSLGTVVLPSKLTMTNMRVMLKAFSKLPYDFLVKWDEGSIPDCPNNVKVKKWVPQKEILRHPNTKLFITQGGLQSTDEAIIAGVPMIGIPFIGDQWYNVAKYVHFKIGLRIDYEDLTEEKILNAVKTVIEDESYRENIKAFRSRIYDRPQTSLQRAVFWTEYILRHGKVPHRKTVSPYFLSTWQNLELELVLGTVFCCILLLFTAVFLAIKLLKFFSRSLLKSFKLKID